MAVRFWVASILASTLIAMPAAAYERHVLGARLNQRLLSSKAGKHEFVDVFVRAKDRAALERALGTSVHGQDGLYSARVPLAVASRLAAVGAADRVELAPRMYPLLDRSKRDVRVTDVHDGAGLSSKHKGRGVLVGVLDTGIDSAHPAFLNQDGRTRIVAIWDQDGDGDGPPGFGYGSVCTRGDIDDGRCRIGDSQGHGTHVAGILAGAMEPHSGIAPEAELVVVKSTRFTDVAGAVEWMFRIAKEQGKPIVINLSIGGHLGPHDGQSELELALEKLQGPGRIIVAAAGNDGATPIHLTGAVSEDARAELVLPLPGAPTPTLLEIWEAGVNGVEFSLELRDYDGTLLDQKVLTQHTEASLRAYDKYQGTVTYMVEPGTGAQSGRTHHVISVDRSDMRAVEEARWFVAWKSTKPWDAWISVDDYRYGSAEFATRVEDGDVAAAGFVPGDVLKTLTIPGTARRMITVGSYVTKNEWESRFGKTFRLQSIPLESLSDFSSHGPTAAPALTGDKPDLVAPGQLIAGPLAGTAEGFARAVALDEHFAIMQGTSMAAPHVAGTVALMLEISPELTPEQAKEILVRHAKTDAQFDGQTPNERVGFGRLDALAAVQAVDGTYPRKGCHNLPQTEGLVLLTTIAIGFAMLAFQRRLRLYRWRVMSQNQA